MNSPRAGAFSASTGVDGIDRALTMLGLTIGQPPTRDQWGEFLSVIAYEYHHSDAARFETLFAASPIPTIEQDYTEVVARFQSLRFAGITDIGSHIEQDPDALRELVGLIRNVAVNPAAVVIIGLTEEHAEGFIDPAIVNEESVGSWIDQLETVWHGRTFSEYEYLGRTLQGTPFDARRTMAVPVGPLGPDFRRVVVTIEDATRERDEQRRLQHLVEEKNAFLAAVSHEIRTPLTGVLGFTEILMDGGQSMSESERAEILASIARQAQDVSDIVEDLLIAARSESGDLAVTREPVDLAAEVATVLENGGSHTEGVEVDVDATSTVTTGDPGRVRQIIRNLLTNAERYGGPDVRIDIRKLPEAISVTVSDDGAGVAAERLDTLFTSAGPVSAATVSGSAGLGLSICRNLAELMGGSLIYERRAGRTHFSLSLPTRD
ncbi:MAG: HAMP domain-containing histidine kinase [Acidimicrobiia bacterium]|nr:HAMP domain-containing histidine kinase [Acidimicrobiia bacterium]